jgi:Glycosyltransferase like family 2
MQSVSTPSGDHGSPVWGIQPVHVDKWPERAKTAAKRAYDRRIGGLSVIIPATNSPETLDAVIAAIESAAKPEVELIVVRNASKPGPAAARNEGARRATGDVLVFVDADVELHADALERIDGAFAADPSLAALFGAYDDAPRDQALVSSFRNLLHHHVHTSNAGPATTFWAGVGAVRRDAFSAVGGFDEQRYPTPSIEDIDLGSRLHAAGYRIVLDPAIQGTHLKRWTLTSMVETDLLQRGVPWVELLLSGRADPKALNLGWRHRVSVLASVVLAGSVVTRRPAAGGAALLTLVAANRSFYGLLARRRGPLGAAGGVLLHAVHHLTAAAAAPLGLLAYVRRRYGAVEVDGEASVPERLVDGLDRPHDVEPDRR